MKEIGDRIEAIDGKVVTTYIVELTEYELSQLKLMLETRNLDQEESDFEAWKKRFLAGMKQLDLPALHIDQTLWQYGRDRGMYDFAFQASEGSQPLEFDEWARRIVETHDDKGRPLRPGTMPVLAFRNFGAKRKADLMRALKEYTSRGSTPLDNAT